MATDPSSSATGLNYDGPSVRTNESGGVPAMYTETPVLPATMMVQPPRPPVPLRVAKVSAAGRDAAVEKSIERLLTVSRKEGNTVYRDGCAVAHEATPRNDDRLCSAIYEKVCDPAIALADLSQTELRILRGKVALANHRKQLEEEAPVPRAPLAAQKPAKQPHRRLKPPPASQDQQRETLAMEDVLKDIDRIKKQRDTLSTQVKTIEDEKAALKARLERIPEIGAEREREDLAAHILRLTAQVERLKGRLESPGMAALAAGDHPARWSQAPPEAERLHTLCTKVKRNEWSGCLHTLLDLDGDGFLSTEDLRHSLDALTGQSWTTRHIRNLLSSLNTPSPTKEAVQNPVWEDAFVAVVTAPLSLRDAKRKRGKLQAEEAAFKEAMRGRDLRISALRGEVAELSRSLPAYMQSRSGEPILKKGKRTINCAEVARTVAHRDDLLCELDGLQTMARETAFSPSVVLTPAEEALLRSHTCGRQHAQYNASLDAMSNRHTAPLLAQITLKRIRGKTRRTPSVQEERIPPKPPEEPKLRPKLPAQVHVYSGECPSVQGVFSLDTGCTEGLRWASGGNDLFFDDANQSWVLRSDGEAVLRGSVPGECAVADIVWEGAPQTLVKGVTRKGGGGGGGGGVAPFDPWRAIYTGHALSSSAFRACPTGASGTDPLNKAIAAAHRAPYVAEEELRTYQPPLPPFS